jgi:serine/threonine-protein kinase
VNTPRNLPPSLVGQTIGNYKVVEQIGEGGMGVVYMAEHPVIGRKVAIKLLHTSFAHDPETVARFFNEARTIHMIRHHNIVEVLDFGQTADGQPYFTMELLSGQSLAARIEEGPVPPAEAVAIVSQICDALQAAHDKNVIHRDLKPHNVYLVGPRTPPEVKILDFGVAKMTSGWGETSQSGGRSVKTRTGSLMGTPLYMSPEQCRGSGKLDHRTDIYSLAVILFEMISGRPPFVAEGVGELFAKHMLEPPPSLATLAPGTPPHIVRAVARALSKDIEERFPDMQSLKAALNTPDPEPRTAERPSRAIAAAGANAGANANADVGASAGAGPGDGTGHDDGWVRGTAARLTTAASVAGTDGRAEGTGGAGGEWRESGNPRNTQGPLRGPGETAGSMPVAQSTTFSSAASELDDSFEDLPRRSHRGLVLAGLAALAVVAGGVFIARRPAPPLAPTAVPRPAPSSPSSGASAPGRAAAGQPPAPAANVTLRIEAVPATAHLLRKPGPGVGAGVPPEDLGQVPVELSLPQLGQPRDYLLRAEGHKDRMVRVDPQHDHGILRFNLEPALALSDKAGDKAGEKVGDKRPRPPERKPAPKPIRRVPIHDADGLAVPSF